MAGNAWECAWDKRLADAESRDQSKEDLAPVEAKDRSGQACFGAKQVFLAVIRESSR